MMFEGGPLDEVSFAGRAAGGAVALEPAMDHRPERIEIGSRDDFGSPAQVVHKPFPRF